MLCLTAIAIIVFVLGIGVIGGDLPQDQGHQAYEGRDRVPEMKFIKIQKGTFMMGSKTGEKNERPVHEVTINHDFELQETEVVQAQWEALMGKNPSHYRGPDRPVEMVSWDEIKGFIDRLNDRRDGYRYRLPTEAEWEYAERAGITTEFAGDLDEMVFYDKNSGLTTHPVRRKRPNNWGLYDIQGNVAEWVQDWYGKYEGKPVIDPQGPAKGSLKVIRGGGWHTKAEGCRSALRVAAPPEFRNSALGFRLARTAQ